MKKTCEMCKKEYETSWANQRTCKSSKCKRELYKLHNKKKKKQKTKLTTKKCIICNEEFMPKSPSQKMCKKQECHDIRKTQYGSSYRKKTRRPSGNNIREYSFTSNMMITKDLNKGISIKQMSEIYDRDVTDLKNHIEKIIKNGTVSKITKMLKEYDNQ